MHFSVSVIFFTWLPTVPFLRNCRKVAVAFTLTQLECFGGGLGRRQSGKLNSSVKFSLKFKVRDSAGGLLKFSSVAQLPLSLSASLPPSLSLCLSLFHLATKPSSSMQHLVGASALQTHITYSLNMCTGTNARRQENAYRCAG